MTFDHVPAGRRNSTALLGDGRGGPIVAVETDGLLTVRPMQLRMKYIVAVDNLLSSFQRFSATPRYL